MKICEQTQIKMLEGVALSPEEQSHLGVCADCRMTAELVKRMDRLPAVEQEVPAYLDKSVLHAAAEALPKTRWKPVVWKIVFPVAAAFAFAAGLLFYQPGVSRRAVSPSGNMSASVAMLVDEHVEETFDDKVIALAFDVGSGMDSLTEVVDSVNDSLDFVI